MIVLFPWGGGGGGGGVCACPWTCWLFPVVITFFFLFPIEAAASAAAAAASTSPERSPEGSPDGSPERRRRKQVAGPALPLPEAL